MKFNAFFQAIQAIFSKNNEIKQSQSQIKSQKLFLQEFNELLLSSQSEEPLAMTKATILFEGYYRYLADDYLKQQFAEIRAKRWAHHFGTPTVTFLLSFKQQIDLTMQLFTEHLDLAGEDSRPWQVSITKQFAIDKANNLFAEPASVTRVEMPQACEVTGFFTKTHNPFGGFTTTPCDPVSQKFIEHAVTAAKTGEKVLEIGAAFGAATLKALAGGATVYCNDIDAANLAVVQQRRLMSSDDRGDPVSGDSNRLILVPGALPNELLGLPQGAFSAILICRVLHFFTGAKIEEALALLSNLLAPGGKIYIVCETPYLKNWQRFLPELQKRIDSSMQWPGEITNPVDYESSGRASSLPKFVHWITKEILTRSLSSSGLDVTYCDYINRAGQFPEDLLLDGRESVGAIGMKS